MKTYEEIKEFLQSHEGIEGGLTIDMTERLIPEGKYFEIADNYITSLGLKPIYKQWKVFDKDHTINLLLKMLNRSMAYDVEMMPLKTAKHVASKFVAQFDKWGATYLSNGDIHEGSAGWNPITESTMEMVVVIFDSKI